MSISNSPQSTLPSWFTNIFLGGYLIRLAKWIVGTKSRLDQTVAKEQTEVRRLRRHQESWRKFLVDSFKIFKDFFIPHDGNDHRPKILRPRALTVIILIATLLKLSAIGTLFFIYPSRAHMSELLTEQLLALTNQSRAASGLPALSMDPELTKAANSKATDMLERNYFAHQSPGGNWPWDWIDQNSYSYLYAGENLAMNFSSAESAHQALMLSPGHKKNILSERYADVGLAVVNGTIDGEETSLLVEIFAARRPVETAIVKLTEQPAPLKPILPAPVLIPATPTVTMAGTDSSASSTAVLALDSPAVFESPQPSLEPATATIKLADATPSNTSTSTAIMPLTPFFANSAATATEDLTNRLPAYQLATTPPSPNPELLTAAPTTIQVFSNNDHGLLNLALSLLRASRWAFVGIIGLLTLALFINIFVRIEIQHKPVIFQTLMAIVLIIALVSVRVHFVEGLTERIAVL
ncbi:MAG TPA: hypothetical protein DEQ86_00950 [Candidatus Jacksonbacteria bacterium]|nr:MAG: hypothetical protein A2240_01610 [Candidatus Jacksonbacteria bacterium RIFOXYA2_FULL_43_12]HCE48746.1 hypothetical protein [Candidatus Jacksonbacteria bacterium]